MDIMRELIEKKELLQTGDRETAAWAEKQGISYGFNQQGDLLASGRAEAYWTEDEKVISGLSFDGSEREGLPEEKLTVPVLYFIPAKLGMDEYDSNKNLQKKEIPLPLGYQVREIRCEDEIFCILPSSEHSEISGTFHTIHIAVGMVETLYYNRGVSQSIIEQCYFSYLAEDHRKYMEERQINEQRKLASSNGVCRSVNEEDFYRIHGGDYECEYTVCIWGREVGIYGLYEGSPEDVDQALKSYADQLNLHVKWIEDHKAVIQRAVLKAGMLEVACDWMEGCIQVEKNGRLYYDLGGGQLFPAPITEQAFLDSLYIEGINASCDEDIPREVLFDIFLDTSPDFFAYHSIEVFITAAPGENGWNYEISVNGLAG